jgi:hypothetical protein
MRQVGRVDPLSVGALLLFVLQCSLELLSVGSFITRTEYERLKLRKKIASKHPSIALYPELEMRPPW